MIDKKNYANAMKALSCSVVDEIDERGDVEPCRAYMPMTPFKEEVYKASVVNARTAFIDASFRETKEIYRKQIDKTIRKEYNVSDDVSFDIPDDVLNELIFEAEDE